MPYQLPTFPELPRPGSLVGPYRIEHALCEGGMGRVYRAVDAEGNLAALKIVKPEFSSDRVYRRRFEREVAVACAIEHPHVVPVLGAGEQDGMLYLATRFIGNGSLADRLRDGRTLPLSSVVRLCLQAASGLDAIHAFGVVHRDVKPPNLLVDEAERTLVGDFGIAKPRDASVLTTPGQGIGTPSYVAPEQIRGDEVTAATDVYALGCVAFECLTGRRLFAGRRGADLLLAHLYEAPPDPLDLRPELPADVGWVVLRAVEKDPAARPPTATSFARMLQVAARSS